MALDDVGGFDRHRALLGIHEKHAPHFPLDRPLITRTWSPLRMLAFVGADEGRDFPASTEKLPLTSFR